MKMNGTVGRGLNALNAALHVNGVGELNSTKAVTQMSKIWMIPFFVILVVLIYVGNCIVLVAYCKVKRLRKSNSVMMVQLTVTDLVAGLTLIFQAVTVSYDYLFEDVHICILWYALIFFRGMASILSLFMITVDRYFAITNPLKHMSRNKTAWFVGVALSIWIPAFVLGFIMPILWHKDWSFEKDKECELPLVIPEIYISWIVVPFFVINAAGIVFMYIRIEHAQRKSMSRDKHKMAKLSRTVALVLACFFTCWTPIILMLGVHSYTYMNYNPLTLNIRLALAQLTALNSAVNPVIYVIRYRQFRKAFLEAVGSKRVRPASKVTESSAL
ncbi:probable G-protein coupled receptor No18 [Lingula anatina]|uniref:Probable G-protein coupled receptor No18 n=1 Tax=Lingula anatina TaxID=7574 RepID=A0A1S3JCJ1_LINAN|nr:probable G-protein coupled receptor No18 [Lingula anatina]|eukprot:XP_013408117.1 probable G-protein coupled receptor No18 [Lingula anatina]